MDERVELIAMIELFAPKKETMPLPPPQPSLRLSCGGGSGVASFLGSSGETQK